MPHPIVRRFRIRRHPRELYPWSLTDRARPRRILHRETHAEAIATVDEILRREAGR